MPLKGAKMSGFQARVERHTTGSCQGWRVPGLWRRSRSEEASDTCGPWPGSTGQLSGAPSSDPGSACVPGAAWGAGLSCPITEETWDRAYPHPTAAHPEGLSQGPQLHAGISCGSSVYHRAARVLPRPPRANQDQEGRPVVEGPSLSGDSVHTGSVCCQSQFL